MPTVSTDAPENEIRRAMADVHRTVATIYDNAELPLLYWSVETNGQAHAYAYDFGQLAPFAEWLDDPEAGHSGTESYDHHWITGLKEGVPIKITYLVEFVAGHAELPRMIP
jgi:hypothetical protein